MFQELWSFITLYDNTPFLVGYAFLAALLLIEVIAYASAGHSWGDWLHGDLSTDGMELETSLDFDLWSWLNHGKLPWSIFLIAWIFTFSTCGWLIQLISWNLIGDTWSIWFSSLLAFAASVFVVRIFTRALALVIPRDETYAVSSELFIGQLVVVREDQARLDLPVQALLKDAYGQSHYLNIAPDERRQELLKREDRLIVVKKRGAFYDVVKADLQ